MRKSMILSLMLTVVFGLAGMAQEKTEKIKVDGKCDMCENRIESAAKAIVGVTKVDWNKESKILEVSFDESKTDLTKIQKAIAMKGHDTELFAASDKAYNDLPSCCKYERVGSTKHHNHGMKGCSHDSEKSSSVQKNTGCSHSGSSTSGSSCCNGK